MLCEAAVTLDSTFLSKTASRTDQPLTQEELLVGKPNSRVFTLDKDDSRNPSGRTLQFFSTYDPIRVGGALPVTLYNGIWHQISKEFTIANAAPTIHDYDEQSDTSKGKGKSLPDTEDDIDESLQKAIDLSIRESPLAPNAILPPRKGLILKEREMSTITAPTETVGFTTTVPTQEQRVARAFGKAMKKYDPPKPPPGNPSGSGPPGGGGSGPPGGGGGPDPPPPGGPDPEGFPGGGFGGSYFFIAFPKALATRCSCVGTVVVNPTVSVGAVIVLISRSLRFSPFRGGSIAFGANGLSLMLKSIAFWSDSSMSSSVSGRLFPFPLLVSLCSS